MEYTENSPCAGPSRLKLWHLLFISFTVISALPVLMLAFWVQQTALDREIAAVEDKHLLLARNLTGALDRYVRDVETGFRVAADNLRRGNRVHGISGLLKSLKLRHICIVDSSGSVLDGVDGLSSGGCGSFPPELLQGALRPWWKEARENPSEVVYSDVMPDAASRPTLYLFQVIPGDRTALGALDTGYIAEVVRSISFGKRGHAAIVDRKGRVLAHPNPQWRAEMKDLSRVKPVSQMMKGKTGTVQFYSPSAKSDMITGYNVVPGVGWGVMVPQPFDELVERAEEVQKAGLAIAAAGIFIAVLLGWWLARHLSGPIEGVARSAVEVAAGLFQSRVTNPPRMAPQELRELTHSFNRMVSEVAGKTDALQETATRLAEALRIARMGNWEWNILEDRLWWSDEIHEFFGMEKRDTPPNYAAFLNLVHPQDRNRVEEEISLAIQLRQPFEITHRMLIGERSERIVHLQADLAFGDQGRLHRIFGTLHDITERFHSEKLRESEERFRSLVGQAADAFLLLDGEGVIVDVNQRACDDLLYTREELLRLSLADFTEGEDEAPFVDRIRSLEPGRPLTFTANYRRKDGERFPVEVKTGMIESGGSHHYLLVVRDISDRRGLEKQLMQSQKMEAIGRLAGGIAHDFNNILVPILGYTELTMNKLKEGSESHKNLAVVRKAALRAKDIVSQILLFSRKTESRPEVFSLTPLINDTLNLMRSTLPKNIEIHGQVEEEDVFVYADVTQVHQMLLNLYVNAGQAMPEGGELTVGMEQVMLENYECYNGQKISGPYARLFISDTGVGMDEDTLSRIFEPFFTTKPVGQGTGLGLSSVLGVIRQHEGAINILSQPGRGTTFEVFLKASARPPRQAKVARAGGRSVTNSSILVVDDEEAITDLVKKVLESLGHRVRVFNDSVKALEEFTADRDGFDLVISDQMMPRMTGEKLIHALRAVRPDIPVILCTGFSDVLSPEKLRAMKVNRFFHKPISSRELGELVNQVLQQARLLTERKGARITPDAP